MGLAVPVYGEGGVGLSVRAMEKVGLFGVADEYRALGVGLGGPF